MQPRNVNFFQFSNFNDESSNSEIRSLVYQKDESADPKFQSKVAAQLTIETTFYTQFHGEQVLQGGARRVVFRKNIHREWNDTKGTVISVTLFLVALADIVRQVQPPVEIIGYAFD
jgi:hypothetical protein